MLSVKQFPEQTQIEIYHLNRHIYNHTSTQLKLHVHIYYTCQIARSIAVDNCLTKLSCYRNGVRTSGVPKAYFRLHTITTSHHLFALVISPTLKHVCCRRVRQPTGSADLEGPWQERFASPQFPRSLAWNSRLVYWHVRGESALLPVLIGIIWVGQSSTDPPM